MSTSGASRCYGTAVSRSHDPELQAGGLQPPRHRGLALVVEEIDLRRAELDEHLARGRGRLAGECCSELEQLTRELAALRR